MTRSNPQPANPTSIAVAIPCHNEAHTIGGIVASFLANLPAAQVLVLDNASTDDTARVAAGAGAIVQSVPQLGKGIAVRAAFDTLDADIIVLIDGDGTYDPADAMAVVTPVLEGCADMVVGERLTRASARAFKPLRHGGNHAITFLVGLMFGHRYNDVLSGYRAVTREFVHQAELTSEGFEIEVEMLAAAHRLGSRIVEVPVRYEARHPLSASKLVPLDDAILILSTAWRLRPRRRS